MKQTKRTKPYKHVIEELKRKKGEYAVKMLNMSLKSDSKEYQEYREKVIELRDQLEELEGSRGDHLSKQIENAKNAGIKAKVVKAKKKK